MSQNANTLEGLRGDLFITLRELRAGKIDLDTAKAVNEVARTLIESAKVEVDAIKVTGGRESGFLGGGTCGGAAPEDGLPPGITGRTVHRLKG
ncbi:hypothetical protein [Aquariibacter albus]|uniref:Uncharacterized protein n=1 Tax=Aquariibacter albus TaxID=2759899 RepID=A0A839HPJ3_9BURK|nr:hypothetical protein [Aquariibacter albus]MBB1161508.1 hypothetical protein [Aquariibacter albus]